MDINDPRNNPNRAHPDLRPGISDPGFSMWPIVAVVAALVAGLLFFGNSRTEQPPAQVGQNVELPTMPKTPGNAVTPQ